MTRQEWTHFHLISTGPLMLARVQLVGDKWPVKWSVVLKAVTKVMRSHGLKQKDCYSIERLEAANVAVAASAFESGAGLNEFFLYEWEGTEFVPVRAPVREAKR